MIRKLAATAAAIAILAASPATAAATSAQALSLSGAAPAGARAGSSLNGESNIEGLGTGAYIIGAIVIGLAIWGIVELVDNGHDDNNPTSP